MSKCERCNYTMPSDYHETICKDCKKLIRKIIENEDYNPYKKALKMFEGRINWLIIEAASLPDPNKNKQKYTIIKDTINNIKRGLKIK